MKPSEGLGSFRPPRVVPSRKPLRFPFNLTMTLTNNLELIPQQAFEEPLAIVPGPPRMAFFCGPEEVKTLLHTRHAEFPKGRLQNAVLEPVFGNAMISSEGHDWRWQRSVAAPLFRHDELMRYGPVMTEAAEATVSTWRSAEPGSIRLINKDMMRAAFHVISNTMLAGGAPSVIAAIEKGHSDYYAGANWWIVYGMLGLPHWLPRPGGRRMRAHERRLRGAVAELVRSRDASAADGNDLLARLVGSTDPETGRSMPGELLVDNIVSFLMAGYDTTALALTWTLYLISQSPEWEERMLAEIESVVGSEPVTAAHYRRLGVVQQVVSESLRLYPTAPVIIRDIVDDVSFYGTRIPAGTIGIIPIYAIHRHRSFWDDPDRFDPGRFDPDRAEKPSRYQYMPFGAGPRICLGATFALIEATIMVATFVRAARFEVDPQFIPTPTGRMFLLPKNGMPMRVMLRERKT
jgi:cytochrome P450